MDPGLWGDDDDPVRQQVRGWMAGHRAPSGRQLALEGTGQSVAGAGQGATRGYRSGRETWSKGFVFASALTVGGGMAEVQRDIVAEPVLELSPEAQR